MHIFFTFILSIFLLRIFNLVFMVVMIVFIFLLSVFLFFLSIIICILEFVLCLPWSANFDFVGLPLLWCLYL